MERNAYRVMELPFWRWAVAIDERADLPALPFYLKASALVFADDVRQNFPDRAVVLIKRTLRGVVTTRRFASRGAGE